MQEKIKVQSTEKIVLTDTNDIEQELRELSREELEHKLKYEVEDPEVADLIKKILSTKA